MMYALICLVSVSVINLFFDCMKRFMFTIGSAGNFSISLQVLLRGNSCSRPTGSYLAPEPRQATVQEVESLLLNVMTQNLFIKNNVRLSLWSLYAFPSKTTRSLLHFRLALRLAFLFV